MIPERSAVGHVRNPVKERDGEAKSKQDQEHRAKRFQTGHGNTPLTRVLSVLLHMNPFVDPKSRYF
jgi:hypothetical protein